jgi:ribonuclease R
MNGMIELHGAKLVFADGNTYIPINSTSLLPGDYITIDSDGRCTLISRPEQVAIGIIRNIYNGAATLWIATIAAACPFQPTVTAEPGYKIGDRLVLWLKCDGSIIVKSRFSSSARDDARSILDAYCTTKERHAAPEYYDGHHYTRDDIIDHSNLDTFTIDPENSVDFDDAVSVDIESGNIYIHIVDIAGNNAAIILTKESTKRLRERCFSLYLANEHTEHLLDSEDTVRALSLVVGEPRQVITVRVSLQYGEVISYDIYRSTIVVKKRWTYEQVAAALADGSASPSIRLLADLHKLRSMDVQYSIKMPSMRLKIGPYGLPLDARLEATNDTAHGLVATTMILANLVVSKHLRCRGIVLPNRFHDHLRGMKWIDFPSTGDESVDSFILLKRYARANYTIDQRGHFGLGLTDYVHFTSPMRRYADVLVHKLLAGWKVTNHVLEQEVTWLNSRAILCRTLQDVYMNWKIIHWLKTIKVLEPVYITDVKKVGVMWFMPSLLLNGFTHVANIVPNQFWAFDSETQSLSGPKAATPIHVSNKMTPILDRIDPITGAIYLILSQTD